MPRWNRVDRRVGQYRPRRRVSKAGGLSLTIDASVIDHLAVTSSALKAVSPELEKTFRQRVLRDEFLLPLAAAMQTDAVGAGRQGPSVAPTIKAGSGAKPWLSVGALSTPQWAGAVFGGQRGTMAQNRKDPQTMTWTSSSGNRTRKIIHRRQTMQFLPHAGTTGYLVFPTWRRVDRALSARLVAAMDQFVEEMIP